MVTWEEMRASVGHLVNLYFTDGDVITNVKVDSCQYEPADDKEPFLLYGARGADYMSSIEKIEILDD